MSEVEKRPVEPAGRHLPGPDLLAGATSTGPDLTRGHGQGNGLRVHGLYFAGVALVGLVLVVVAILLAAR